MGQHINAEITLSAESSVQIRWSLPSFRIYAEHYLIRWSTSWRECVCASSGCSRLVTQCGADCVGRCCFMRQAHFYHRLVLYPSDIKLVVQSCLKKVRRGACGIISLCISHIIEPLSFPAKTNTEATYQWWLKMFCERARMLEWVSIIPHEGSHLFVKYVRGFVHALCLTGISMQRCKSTIAAEEKLSLKLPL